MVAHGSGEKDQVVFEQREIVKLDLAIATATLEDIDRGAVPAKSPLLDPSRWPELSLAPEKRPASEADTRDLPRELMREVLWTFIGPQIERLDAFCAEVRQYHLDIAHTDEAWRPDEVVLARPRVQVLYRCWRGQRQVEPVVKIAARDGASFTAGELLWRVHNAVRHDLHDMDAPRSRSTGRAHRFGGRGARSAWKCSVCDSTTFSWQSKVRCTVSLHGSPWIMTPRFET